MDSNPSLNSLLSIIITLILVQAPAATFCQNNEYVSCGDSFSCANIENIGYPFWGGSRPAYCGHPAFELNCSNEFPEIAIRSVQYRIFNISNQSQTAKIARNDLLNNICPWHPQNASLDFNLFNYVPSGDQNISLFYGCSTVEKPALNCSEPNNSTFLCNNENPPPVVDPSRDSGPTSHLFNCTESNGGNSSHCNIIIKNQASFASIPHIFNCSEGNSSFGVYGLGIGSLDNVRCGIRVVVTVTQGAFEALGNASEELIRTSMASGFAVEWKVNNSLCEESMRSGGRCGSNANLISTQFVCYCANPTFSSTCTNIRSHTNGGNNGMLPALFIVLSFLISLLTLSPQYKNFINFANSKVSPIVSL
ncbi:PREDICTED: LEAF RUST 10 DISEASE-RESISTANCE LOCUS RECEPTOR-LIKE PROTEIN KINASE-like 2.1 [Ipomoea nil]|uniref:LEAF RUST 10 DISEASE-RESISTANCE LOCUS RECEPTOR-LIKE PROTEIN KINASE-like 2.1 n=1 Tax=Ipomoea nil TaxID=35883 RepID=UPI000901493D|nr:PREDICTED: LEAF RUST 10 DISEASE-RESISTANCE LOCUS RECEPTOR-LIKE PROTEIN KINASE-like 2.1 [Ipomoea nil]